MTNTEPTHQRLATTSDVVHIVRDLLTQIEIDEAAAIRRLAEAAPAPYPSTSGNSQTIGGPTNRAHNFGTDNDPDIQLVPQHSDPVGEAVAWNTDDSADMPNIRKAYTAALAMMRSAEECRSHLAQTDRRERMKAEDRTICWLCLDAGYTTDLGARGRDSNANGIGTTRPRCSWHYDFILTNRRDATLELTLKHCRGERIYDKDIDQALGKNTTRKPKNRKRKTKRK